MLEFDTNFVKKLKQWDHKTFNEFYLKTSDVFFRYIKSNYFVSDEDCYDILSIYFVKQRENLHKIDESKSFSAYIRTVFKNTIKDYFKKAKDVPFSYLDDASGVNFEDTIISESDIIEILDQKYKYQNIEQAMQKLKAEDREIIYFKFIEEKSYSEISEIIQISEQNIRKKISRALNSLKEFFWN